MMDAATRDSQAQIIVARTSPDDVQQRQIVVKVDGQRIGELMFGESVTVPVRPGPHELKVDNTWNWKTVKMELAAGEQARFQAKSHAGTFASFLAYVFGAGPIYVSIERE
jgi:hypothetical protein